jgi:Flp pilus assembly protein TadD
MWPATPGSGRLLGLCLAAGALAIVSGSAPATQTGDALDLREQAMALVAAGDDDRALAALRRAIDANPHNPYLWRALGRAAARLGRRDQAVAALEQAYGSSSSARAPRI